MFKNVCRKVSEAKVTAYSLAGYLDSKWVNEWVFHISLTIKIASFWGKKLAPNAKYSL